MGIGLPGVRRRLDLRSGPRQALHPDQRLQRGGGATVIGGAQFNPGSWLEWVVLVVPIVGGFVIGMLVRPARARCAGARPRRIGGQPREFCHG